MHIMYIQTSINFKLNKARGARVKDVAGNRDKFKTFA